MTTDTASLAGRIASPVIAEAVAYIHAHPAERLSLGRLAARAGLSPWHFATLFRRHTGTSPHRYLCITRVRHAQALLVGGTPVAVAALAAGFCDQSHLTRHFKLACGLTPGQYLARHRGAARSAPPDHSAARHA